MGLFGFGRKHKDEDKSAEDEKKEDKVESTDAASDEDHADTEDASERADADAAEDAESESVDDGDDAFDGPWDIDDPDVPDFSKYLDVGSMRLPYVQGIQQLRLKISPDKKFITGAIITAGQASLEMEAFAAPKSSGLWNDIRAELIEAHPDAKETDGEFGTELLLPVPIPGGRHIVTRVVGVDGPRWMLRGIFTGNAVKDGTHEAEVLVKLFKGTIVERGAEPLAPRDLIPMHPPVQAKAVPEELKHLPDKQDGPLTYTQETKTQNVMQRGPMFTEMR